MQDKLIQLIILVLFTPMMVGTGSASDLEKEKRWAEQISDALLDGETCELKAGDTAFTGIFTEATQGNTGRMVILAHGMGAHPDWPDVINPLRTGLAEHGWSTLSVQMPVLANDAPIEDYLPLFDESGPRLQAAVDHAREQGAKTLVIVAHSLGASMAAHYLADKPDAVAGLVIVGMGVIEFDDKMNGALALEKLTLPVLDLYGSRDLETVLDSRERRAKAAQRAGNTRYRQTRVEGADHFFIGLEGALVRRVYGWLKRTFETPDN